MHIESIRTPDLPSRPCSSVVKLSRAHVDVDPEYAEYANDAYHSCGDEKPTSPIRRKINEVRRGQQKALARYRKFLRDLHTEPTDPCYIPYLQCDALGLRSLVPGGDTITVEVRA